MSNSDVGEERELPTHCPRCGTGLTAAVVDFDSANENRAEFNAGEMVAIDYCPNPECRWNTPDAIEGAEPPV